MRPSVTKFVDKLFIEINKLYDEFSWDDLKTGFEDFTDYLSNIDFAQYINTQSIVDKFKATIGLNHGRNARLGYRFRSNI